MNQEKKNYDSAKVWNRIYFISASPSVSSLNRGFCLFPHLWLIRVLFIYPSEIQETLMLLMQYDLASVLEVHITHCSCLLHWNQRWAIWNVNNGENIYKWELRDACESTFIKRVNFTGMLPQKSNFLTFLRIYCIFW